MKHIDSTLGLSARRSLVTQALAARAPSARASAEGRDTLSLDGAWALALDPENRGARERWQVEFPADATGVSVPAVWETTCPGYDGVGWYRRRFTLDAAWRGRTLRLRFHAAQYHAEAWLNGVRLGAHEGGFLPFEFDVSAVAQVGENMLVVRVVNPPMDREIDGFRCGAPLNQGPIPIGKAGWYYNFGGLWQSVELLASDGLAISRVIPRPALGREDVELKIVVVSVAVAGRRQIACEIRCGGSADKVGAVVASVSVARQLKVGENVVRVRVPLRGARRWSPDDPYLHTAIVTVRGDGRLCDRLAVRFGMREFTAKDGRFVLNGRAVQLRGFLHQGSYPRTLARPEDRAFAERELRAVKSRGFNFVRAHLQPALPEWLDLCDELGLLVMAEPPIGWLERTPRAEERCWREIEGLVMRDAHHPSIVAWCLMNEVFHLRGFSPEVVVGMTARWLARLRKLDPSRVVIDVSGGHGLLQGGGAEDMLPDTASQGLTALMTRPGAAKPEPVLDAHIYHEFPPTERTLRKFRDAGAGGPLFFISEYGAPPVPPPFDAVLRSYSAEDRSVGLEDYKLHADFARSLRECFSHPALVQSCGGPRRFIEECNRLRAEEVYQVTTAMRANPRLAGYCFCQLADASGELFGALDTWRRPKPMMDALARASSAGEIGVIVTPRVAAFGAAVAVELTWLGGDGADEPRAKAAWTLELVDDAGQVARRWRGAFRAEAGKPRVIFSRKVSLPKHVGSWRWRVSGAADGLALHGDVETRTLAAPVRRSGVVAINGGAAALGAAFSKLGLETSPFGNNYREAERPIFLDLSRLPGSRQQWFEELGQLRKILQLGGCAVVFEPEMGLVREVIPEAAVRMQPIMRSIGYSVPHPALGGLVGGGLMDFSWAELLAEKYDRADDVADLGGEVLAGALSFNMWTRPAAFFHGAALYTLPVGRGTLIVCHLRLGAALAADRVEALALLDGLAALARSRIRSGDTAGLLSRCIDPLRSTEDARGEASGESP